jgi:LmbE family N-acetylglucosaminyl deacetylase
VASLAAARRLSRVLGYESPTSQSFSPDLYVDTTGLLERKLELLRAHVSQVLKNGLVDLPAVEAQARYHGFNARISQAEAFESHRFVWDLIGPSSQSEGQSEGLDQILERTRS